MKNVVNYILSAQKKIFVVAFLAVFSSFYTMVWGAIYTHNYNENIKGSFNTSTKTLTITGTGAIPACTDGHNYYSSNNGNVEKIVIEEGITSIGAYVFDEYTNVTSITFPSTLTRISNNNFGNSKKIVEIHASSPNQWAQVTISSLSGHPFGTTTSVDNDVKSSRGFYFNGSAKKSRALIFTQGLDSIRQYTFCNARYFTSAHIPGSVSRIGKSALMCYFDTVVVNRMDRPILNNSSTISFNNPSVLIVPTNATNFTEARYWLYSTDAGKNSSGARSKNVQNVSGKVDGKDWSLSTSGVLTIDGSGAISTTYTDESGASQYPYYYFRYLVNKVVVTGGITGLSNILQRAQAMRTLEFQQDNISSATTVTPTSYIYDSPITMLFPYTAVENVNLSTWSSYKRQLSNAANIDQSEDNVSLLAALHNNLTEPFNMNLTRTLSNTMYNTYCSPIDMSAEEVTALFGGDTHLVELDAENTGMNEDDELVIAFKDAAEITAGTPYLIQPANNVEDPSFTNVDPSKVAAEEGVVETKYVDFHGTLNKRTISETEIDNQSVIFLTGTIVDGNQQLTWANGGTLKGMRAYWKVKGGTPASVMAKRPVLQIGNGENTTTDLGQVPSDKIQCTKVLRDGQIYILRGEKAYNLQGIEIDRPNKL